MDKLTKIILGNLFRSGLTVLITFLGTKHVLEADVASKLNRGDTVPLWDGAIPINTAMIVNIGLAIAAPILVPLLLGVWSRVRAAYATIVARSEKFAMTAGQLKTEVDKATPTEIISTVAANSTK